MVRDLYGDRRLTRKQCRLLDLLTFEAMNNRQIGRVLGNTPLMVKNLLRPIYDKTGMSTRLELALWWLMHRKDYVDSAAPAAVKKTTSATPMQGRIIPNPIRPCS